MKLALFAVLLALISNHSAAELAQIANKDVRFNSDCFGCTATVLIRPNTRQVSPFYVAPTEVTWRQYLSAVQEASCPLPENIARGAIPQAYSLKDDFAVTGITAAAVKCYISWLNGKTGLKFRLMSPQEWKYVASRAPRNDDTREPQTSRSIPFSREPRDGVKFGRIRQAYHGQPSADGLYGLLDSAGEMVAESELMPEQSCKPYKVKVCRKVSVYGLFSGAPGDSPFNRAYVYDVYTSIYVGFRVARDV